MTTFISHKWQDYRRRELLLTDQNDIVYRYDTHYGTFTNSGNLYKPLHEYIHRIITKFERHEIYYEIRYQYVRYYIDGVYIRYSSHSGQFIMDGFVMNVNVNTDKFTRIIEEYDIEFRYNQLNFIYLDFIDLPQDILNYIKHISILVTSGHKDPEINMESRICSAKWYIEHCSPVIHDNVEIYNDYCVKYYYPLTFDKFEQLFSNIYAKVTDDNYKYFCNITPIKRWINAVPPSNILVYQYYINYVRKGLVLDEIRYVSSIIGKDSFDELVMELGYRNVDGRWVK